MLTCNAFTDNTLPATIRTAQCVANTADLGASELLDEQFLMAVLDSLERLASGEGTGVLPVLADVIACDAERAAINANCALQNIPVPTNNLPAAKIKALILWQLNEALCP